MRWVNRSKNTVADHLCNRTMDVVKGAWREERNMDIPPGCNIVVFSDGGTRETCSASAWLITAVLHNRGVETYSPVVAAGIYFDDPISSFLAEAIALERATVEMLRWCK